MTIENNESNSQESITNPVITNSEQTQVSEENVNKEETSLQENSNQEEESLEQEQSAEEATTTKPEGEDSDESLEVEKPVVEEEINLAEVQDKEKADEVLKDKGFDYAKLQEEYNQSGEISKETRDKLAEAGISDEIIDNYIEGQKAQVETKINEIAQVVGGRKEMDEIITWASKNLPEAEKASINSVRDENIMKIILKDLKERMEDKEGVIPELTKGDGGKNIANLYESQAQMMEEIRDPRYAKDEAYRDKVRKKIEASRVAGTILL